MEELREHATPERALEMFESGAAAGYLNPECYDVPLPAGYADAARELILDDFRSRAGGGLVELLFFASTCWRGSRDGRGDRVFLSATDDGYLDVLPGIRRRTLGHGAGR